MPRWIIAALLVAIVGALAFQGVAGLAGFVSFPGATSRPAGPGTPGTPTTPPAGTHLPLAPVWAGTMTSFGFTEPTYLVIQTEAEWKALWDRAEGSRSSPPAVDFSQRTVLVAVDGMRATSGFVVHVTDAVVTDNGVLVHVRDDVPGAGCLTLQVITYPAHMVSVPKVAGPITFEAQSVPYSCA